MTVAVCQGQVVPIIRVYPNGKWCKVILEDESVEWVRSSDITEEEI